MTFPRWKDAYPPLWYWAALCSLKVEDLPAGSPLLPIQSEQQRRLLCLYHEPVAEASSLSLGLGSDEAEVWWFRRWLSRWASRRPRP